MLKLSDLIIQKYKDNYVTIKQIRKLRKSGYERIENYFIFKYIIQKFILYFVTELV